MTPPEKMVRIADRLKESEHVRVRPLNIQDLPEEIRRLKSIYNAMLERNWLFLPMNEEEFDSITARLRPLVRVRPELCLIAEVKGEPVAFCITLPDSNVAIREAGGQLTRWGVPVGLAKMAWAARRIERLRVLLFGIKPGYRRRGLDALLGLEDLRAARRLGYDGGGARLDHRGQRADEPCHRVHRRSAVQDVPDLRQDPVNRARPRHDPAGHPQGSSADFDLRLVLEGKIQDGVRPSARARSRAASRSTIEKPLPTQW